MRKHGGSTLVEMMLSAAILVIFMIALFWMLPAGGQMWEASATRASSRQDLQIAANAIAAEIQDSDYSHITDTKSTGLPQFYFQSAYAYNDSCGGTPVPSEFKGDYFCTDGSGNPSWQKYVMYCISTGTTSLIRLEGPLTAIPTCDASGSNWKLVSPVITRLSLVKGGIFTKSAQLFMTARTTNKQGKVDQQSMSMTIFMRN